MGCVGGGVCMGKGDERVGPTLLSARALLSSSGRNCDLRHAQMTAVFKKF